MNRNRLHQIVVKRVSRAGLLLIAICSASISGAQQNNAMTLQELINQALKENYDIRIYRNQELQAENSNTIGNAGMLPQLDLTAEQSYSINNSRQEFFTGDSQEADAARSESTSAQAAVRWVVFDGLSMFARKDQLEQLAMLSKTDTRYYIEQTAADVAMAYFQLKQEKQLLEAYRKTLDVTKSRLELQERRLEIGAGNALDVHRAKVDRNADSSLVLSQLALIRELELRINTIINRDLELDLNPVDEFNLENSFDLMTLLENAQAMNAQLTQQQIQEMVAMNEVEIQKGQLFPELELFGNYTFGRQSNEVGFLQASRSFGPNFGVRIRFNLFNGGQERIQMENSRIEAENAGLRSDQVSQQIRAAVRTAFFRWQNEMQQVALEEESVFQASQTLEIATQQYELGAINDIDFRLIQLNELNAKSRYLQAKYRAKSREIELHRLSGRLMENLIQ